MEEYKQFLFGYIYDSSDKTIEDVEYSLKRNPHFIINRNEEGKIHSHYLGDRYEPAIIKQGSCTYHYYLFDGDIKDCNHPFCVIYIDHKIIGVWYYSSKRIKNKEPIVIINTYTYYNDYCGNKILDEYECSYEDEPNKLKEFTLLCDEMIEPFMLKFAD